MIARRVFLRHLGQTEPDPRVHLGHGEGPLQPQRVGRAALIEPVSPHVQGQGLDGVFLQLATLGLQSGRDVGLQSAVLTLDRPDFYLQPGRVRLTPKNVYTFVFDIL